MGTIPVETIWLPRPSSKYPGCYPLHFEKKIPDLLKTQNFIHAFSGMATIGHTVDINKDCNPKTVASIENLPFKNDSFDGAMADPPYNKEFARKLYNCDYPKWEKWTEELVRVVKTGGRIAIMQNYVVPRLKGCKYERIIVIITRIKQFPKIITIQKKIIENLNK